MKFQATAIARVLYAIAILALDLHGAVDLRIEKQPLMIPADVENDAVINFDMGLLQPAVKNHFSIIFDSTKYTDETIEEFSPSCMCTLLDFSPQWIEPGRRVTLDGSITVDPDEFPLRNKTIKIRTNHRTLNIILSGKIATSDTINFGKRTIELKRGNEPHIISLEVPLEWNILGIKCNDASLNDQFRFSHRLIDAKHRQILIEFTHDDLIKRIQSISKTFPYQSDLQITIYHTKSDTEHALSSQLLLKIKYEGELKIVPRDIDLTTPHSAAEGAKMILSGYSTKERMEVIGLPSFISAEVLPAKGSAERVVEIRIKDADSSRSGSGRHRFLSYDAFIILPNGDKSRFTVHTIRQDPIQGGAWPHLSK